jgi:hypothetical protein
VVLQTRARVFVCAWWWWWGSGGGGGSSYLSDGHFCRLCVEQRNRSSLIDRGGVFLHEQRHLLPCSDDVDDLVVRHVVSVGSVDSEQVHAQRELTAVARVASRRVIDDLTNASAKPVVVRLEDETKTTLAAICVRGTNEQHLCVRVCM